MIPQIIHQVWEGKTEPLPDLFLQLAGTWKEHHPSWQFELWNGDRMETLVHENFPEFADTYFGYRYAVQRWDAIRYLILYKMGGLYVDLDYECIKPIDNLLHGKTCCFGMDPDEHATLFHRSYIITNAIMASVAGHPFMEHIIEKLPETQSTATGQKRYVLETTGPFFITNAYDTYTGKNEVHLFPAEFTSPLTQEEVQKFLTDDIDEDLLDVKLGKAVAIHYFFGSWYQQIKS